MASCTEVTSVDCSVLIFARLLKSGNETYPFDRGRISERLSGEAMVGLKPLHRCVTAKSDLTMCKLWNRVGLH